MPNAAWRTDYTQDARRDLGARGISETGHAYAWCARESLYHRTFVPRANAERVSRYMVCERPFARHGHVRLSWPMRVSPKHGASRDVRTVRAPIDDAGIARLRVRAYALYVAQRSVRAADPHDTRGCLPSPIRDVRSVRPTQRAAETMARGNVWGARNADHDAWALAFDARIAARECGCGNVRGCVGYAQHIAR